MIQYTFDAHYPNSQYIDIELSFDVTQKQSIELQLPSWRPGRYELGNFSKNIRGFSVSDQAGSALSYSKTSKDRWKLQVPAKGKVVVRYQYYANRLDAGSCWLDDEQMYVNPVHCCMYVVGREDEAIKLSIRYKHKYLAGTFEKRKGSEISLRNFDHLADTPFIASKNIVHYTYTVSKKKYHIWIQGKTRLNQKKLLDHFKAFTEQQLMLFKSIPCKEYHFLIQATHHKFYHGVEHGASTVLAIGPAAELHKGDLYKELMGVASHELFHVWNVKNIRPKAMLPYDFARENYCELGFVYEGFTTYYGDLFLCRSGFFSTQSFLDELSVRLQKHMSNAGRFNYSVLQSSFDTWLDGYLPGAPYRKTSIYDEGSLIALALDLNIRLNSLQRYSLDDVVLELYRKFGLKKKGYELKDIIEVCSNYYGVSMKQWFDAFVASPVSYIDELSRLLYYFGCAIEWRPNNNNLTSLIGIHYKTDKDEIRVLAIEYNSPAFKGGVMMEDVIQKINGKSPDDFLKLDIKNWINKELRIQTIRNGRKVELKIMADAQLYARQYKIVALKSTNAEQKENRNKWLGSLKS
ncbi:MAG TPA: hypothetical protein PKH65_09300 [Bacteroidia bacterium]|nr:hypothetical protein [Bacteroidia bacterium]